MTRLNKTKTWGSPPNPRWGTVASPKTPPKGSICDESKLGSFYSVEDESALPLVREGEGVRRGVWVIKRRFYCLGLGLVVGSWLGVQGAIASSNSATKSDRFLTIKEVSSPKAQSQSSTCPANIENLTALLLRDLPSYANRVSQSSRRLSRAYDSYSYILLAGRPEFAPLTLGPGEYKPAAPTASSEAYQQVFITTLERSYTKSRVVELQQYHWLFLTQASDGWYLGLMFSQIGTYPNVKPPSPPRESSKGVIGQAISTWLRDCRAGSIR